MATILAEIIPLLCEACLKDLPPDYNGRYCPECQAIIDEERPTYPKEYWFRDIAYIMGGKAWLVNQGGATYSVPMEDFFKTLKGEKQVPDAVQDTHQQKPAPQKPVTKIPQRQNPLGKTGRPKSKLSVTKVRQLAAKGLGSRKIAEILAAEGIKVSYRTICRILQPTLLERG